MPPEAAAPEDASTDLLIRPGAPDDGSALTDLFLEARRAAQASMPAPVRSAEETAAWFEHQLGLSGREPGSREIWVAEREGDIVGYLVLDPEWLQSLYVRPALTHQGIGTALLDLAKGLRPHGFGLWVFESNHQARRFYARRGLLRLERTDGRDNEERSPDVAMAWPGQEPVAYLRRQVDAVDDDLGRALARRAALTAAIQRFKPVPGERGRDLAREAEIADRLAQQAPDLGADRLARILHVVISESLDAVDDPGQGRKRW